MKDTLTALTNEDVTGLEKCLLLGTIVDRVIPHKEGAYVFFAPGIFRDAEGADGRNSTGSLHTFHTNCMVCRVGNGVSHYTLRSFPREHRAAA